MTARIPRQQRAERRREELVAAAAGVISTEGPGAFSARAVATAAGLPLAAVSYYFPRTDDLLAEAIGLVLHGWLAESRAHAALDLGHGIDAAARALTTTILPAGPPSVVLTRYEQLLAAARNPVTAAALAALRPELSAVVSDVLTSTGVRCPVSPDVLIAVIDGAAVGALSENADDPRAIVTKALRAVLTAGAVPQHSPTAGPKTVAPKTIAPKTIAPKTIAPKRIGSADPVGE